MGYTSYRHNETIVDKFLKACDKIPSYIPLGGLGVFMFVGGIANMFN